MMDWALGLLCTMFATVSTEDGQQFSEYADGAVPVSRPALRWKMDRQPNLYPVLHAAVFGPEFHRHCPGGFLVDTSFTVESEV